MCAQGLPRWLVAGNQKPCFHGRHMSQRTITAAVVQMTSKNDVTANLQTASRLIGEAGRRGAKLIVLPENFAFIGIHERDKLPHAESLDGGEAGPIIRAM